MLGSFFGRLAVVEVAAEVLLVVYYGPELASLFLCMLCAEALSLCR